MKKRKKTGKYHGGGWPKGKPNFSNPPANPSYWYEIRKRLNMTREAVASAICRDESAVKDYEDAQEARKPDRAIRELYKQLVISRGLFWHPPIEGK